MPAWWSWRRGRRISSREIRNPNVEIRSKFKIRKREKGKRGGAFVCPFCLFEFSALFRISDFGFRIFLIRSSSPTRDPTGAKPALCLEPPLDGKGSVRWSFPWTPGGWGEQGRQL